MLALMPHGGRSPQGGGLGVLNGAAPRAAGYSSRSSTAPVLALDAFFANFASTPRV